MGCIHLFQLMVLFSLDKFPEVELLNHMVVLFLNFEEPFIVISMVVAHSHQFPRDFFSSHPCLYFLFLVFLTLAFLKGVGWYLIVVWIYISLMISDVGHFLCTCWSFLCLLLGSVYWNLLPSFQSDCLLCYWVVWVLYILGILAPNQVYNLQFFHSVGFLSILLY